MALTSPQLATLKAYINSVPAWAALPNDSDSSNTVNFPAWKFEIADPT